MSKVLVIDDEKDIVSLLRYHLEKAGFQCLEGMDGAVALRLVREHHPDLLILDLMLPGMDGLEICRQLRQDTATSRLPIGTNSRVSSYKPPTRPRCGRHSSTRNAARRTSCS